MSKAEKNRRQDGDEGVSTQEKEEVSTQKTEHRKRSSPAGPAHDWQRSKGEKNAGKAVRRRP